MKKRWKKQTETVAHKLSESRISHSVIGPIRTVNRGTRKRKFVDFRCADCGTLTKFSKWEELMDKKIGRNHCQNCGSTFLEKAKH